jgi:NTE family protein
MKKIGYALSGGGARGFAHLGVLKMLDEIGIKPYAISGTSVGAVIGALYASGKTVEDIMELMTANKYFGWGNISWLKKGLFSMDVLSRLLKDTIGQNDFDALSIKLFVATTDLVKGETVIFSKGNLFEAVIASASVPVLFAPVKIGDKLLVDGGITENLPVAPLEEICDFIIGSCVNQVAEVSLNTDFSRTFNILDRCFHLAIAGSVRTERNKCDVFIEVPLPGFDMFDSKKAGKIFEIGYDTAVKYKEQIKLMVQNKLPANPFLSQVQR